MSDDTLLIKQVRVSFPHFHEKPVINGTEAKCGGVFMLHKKKNAKAIEQLDDAMVTLMKERFKGKKIPTDKRCLRDGDDSGRDEYEDHMTLNASSRSFPVVLDARAQRVTDPTKDAIYAGCYVNVKVRLWAQDNKYGKRINAELLAVQFAGDGAPLDGSYVSEETAVEGFDAIEEDDDILAA